MATRISPAPTRSRKLRPTTILTAKTLCASAIILLTLLALPAHVHAQTAPLPYGTVEYIGHQGPQYAYACNTANGWLQGTTCIDATMHCDPSLNVEDLTFTYGFEGPTGPYGGTVVAFGGGNGTTPSSANGNEDAALQAYLAKFEIVQLAWSSDWEAAQSAYLPINPYGNIQNAACRPAGFLHFVYESTAANNANPVLFQPGGGMCAHGFSAGSAAVVYALSWYGAGWGPTGYLDNAEFLAGPVLSEVDMGCQVPVAPNVTVCQGSPGCKMAAGVQPWSVTPEYVDNDETLVREWTNIYSCARSGTNTAPWNGVWNGMSILSSSVTSQQLSYPSTSMKAWLCANVYNNLEKMNNSGAQGWLFYSYSGVSFMTNNWFVNAVTNCNGPEGILGSNAVGPDGKTGLYDVTQDMLTQCSPHAH